MRGTGRAAFAATLLLIVGVLNIIGIIAGSLGAISALLSVGGSNPWWSLGIFVLCIYIVHGIFVMGEDERALAT
jgi:hypothetical protein